MQFSKIEKVCPFLTHTLMAKAFLSDSRHEIMYLIMGKGNWTKWAILLDFGDSTRFLTLSKNSRGEVRVGENTRHERSMASAAAPLVAFLVEKEGRTRMPSQPFSVSAPSALKKGRAKIHMRGFENPVVNLHNLCQRAFPSAPFGSFLPRSCLRRCMTRLAAMGAGSLAEEANGN